MNREINAKLKDLENNLRSGVLTPARHVDYLTVICLTETSPAGIGYYQAPYELLRDDVQALLKDRVKGDTVGPFKIVAIYDVWWPTHGPKDLG